MDDIRSFSQLTDNDDVETDSLSSNQGATSYPPVVNDTLNNSSENARIGITADDDSDDGVEEIYATDSDGADNGDVADGGDAIMYDDEASEVEEGECSTESDEERSDDTADDDDISGDCEKKDGEETTSDEAPSESGNSTNNTGSSSSYHSSDDTDSHTSGCRGSTTSSSVGTDGKSIPKEDNSANDDEQEEYEEYQVKKCYYPVKMEDFFNKRYSVIRKIGWGHFSTVWLSYDIQTKRFVALKIVRCGRTYCETAEDEIKLGRAVDDGVKGKTKEAAMLRRSVIRVLDNFNLDGPSGRHVCITFDLLGQNLLDLIKHAQDFRKESGSARYGAIPLANVRSITRKILRGLKHLHENCNIIHTDVKPENVLITVPERTIKEMVRYVSSLKKEQRPNYMMSSYEFRQYHARNGDKNDLTIVDDRIHRNFLLDPDPSINIVADVEVKLADLGNACWTHSKFTDEIQTKEYRALESIIVADYGTPADMWSVACVAYECATGDYLFPSRRRAHRTSDEEHLLGIIERCARAIPKKLALRGKDSRKFFDAQGKLLCRPDVSSLLQGGETINEVLMSRYAWTAEQAQPFVHFLMPMLEYDPEQRATASDMMQHAWMMSTPIYAENHLLVDAPSLAAVATVQNPLRQQQPVAQLQPKAVSASKVPTSNDRATAPHVATPFHPPSLAASSSSQVYKAASNDNLQNSQHVFPFIFSAKGDGIPSPMPVYITPSHDFVTAANEVFKPSSFAVQQLDACNSAGSVPDPIRASLAPDPAAIIAVNGVLLAPGFCSSNRVLNATLQRFESQQFIQRNAGSAMHRMHDSGSNSSAADSSNNYDMKRFRPKNGASYAPIVSDNRYGRIETTGKRVTATDRTPTRSARQFYTYHDDVGDLKYDNNPFSSTMNGNTINSSTAAASSLLIDGSRT